MIAIDTLWLAWVLFLLKQAGPRLRWGMKVEVRFSDDQAGAVHL